MSNDRFHFDYCISIDDDENDRMRVKEALESFSDSEFGYGYFLDFCDKKGFTTFRNCDDFYPSEFSLVMLDVDFGYGKERHGLDILKWFEREFPKWPVILTTNFDASDIYKAAKTSKNFAGYIVKSGIAHNTIMIQLDSWLDRQETQNESDYLKYIEDIERVCNELSIKVKDLENKQTSPDDDPRVIFNNFNIRLYKDNLIDKAKLTSHEAWNIARKIEAYVEHGTALKLNYFPTNMDGAFQVIEGRAGGAKRFYFKPKNKSAIIFEISGDTNKVINQDNFRHDLKNNRARYQEYYDKF